MTMTSPEAPPTLERNGAAGSIRRRRPSVARLVAAGSAAAALAALALAFPRFAGAAVPPSATGSHIAVATDQADATRAALDVLSSGGNAVDGAIAAALALGVVNPSASGLGGGGFALVYSAKEKKVFAFDFREAAPATFHGDKLFPKPKPGEAPKPRGQFDGLNGNVIGVPGEPAGLEMLSRRFARKSLADDAAPAVALASGGFYLNTHVAKEVVLEQPRVVASPALSATFLPGGSPATLGSRIKRPELAATLSRFGAEGKRALYEGATAQKIVDAANAAGATMTTADLAAYKVEERAPLTRTIDGRTIYAMPVPSAGGLALLEVLSLYGASESSELAGHGFGSSAYIHLVAEGLRGAFADRARVAGDPAFEKGAEAAYEAALDPAQIKARRARIDLKKTHPPAEFKTRENGTSHLVVADAEGNVVSLTTTVNGIFGSSIVAGDSGVLLNNELEDFTHPDDAALYALKDGGPNRPRGRARPVSSMSPAIILENGEPILAVGGSGGTRIATGVAQATLARLVFGLDPNACVSAPRFHTQGATLFVDKDIAADVRAALTSRGETVKDETFTTAAVQMLAWKRGAGKTTLLAASDPRRAGLSAAR